MLKLVDIIKNYGERDFVVPALKGINLEFRKSEFVSILGASGCGKTTLLNIIGGLDKYSSGDLVINGRSTKNYTDKDWDAYRNRTIGFVFQDYNLIPHLTIAENVELALTLSGIKISERKERALKALERVGLSAHAKKRPNQLSGGQKQRVAIARAIINDPDIILADEPTGALDSKTSVQIMDILKEISKDRLVIMVTHNNELAEEYSTRIISLFDGQVTNDTNPYESKEEKQVDKLEKARTSMSFWTALSISLKNLFTKKARTILTALGSSIGIIGIALVLALSNGFNIYINNMQRDTLATLPITIGPTAMTTEDIENMAQNMQDNLNSSADGNSGISSYVPSGTSYHMNKITQDYIDYVEATDEKLYNFISYDYNMNIKFVKNVGSNYSFVNSKLFELADNTDFLKNEYPLIADGGRYPQNKNEIVLVLNKNNKISEYVLAGLGLDKGEGVAVDYQPNDFIGKTFRFILNDGLYSKISATGEPVKYAANEMNDTIYNGENAIELTIVGIVRNNSTSAKYSFSSMFGGSDSEGLGYLSSLSEYIHEQNYNSNICVDQRANMNVNVYTGLDFTFEDKAEQKPLVQLQKMGGYALPASINIYTTSFEAKTGLKAYLDDFNEGKETKDMILYTDMSEMLSDTFSVMIDAISIVLIVFAAISLIVSSIMIGIITYVSVIERTKEIGVLRSLGARKRDIGRVFNAETCIIGLTSGILGIIITLLLMIPINILIGSLAGSVQVSAVLNPLHALILVALSTVLTLISGLIPSRIASKKEPVTCLRAE